MSEPTDSLDTSPAPDGGATATSADKPGRLVTRRRLLIGAGGVAATGVLAAGGVLVYDQHQRFGREANGSIRDHRVELPASAPRMVIAHGTDPARNVRAAIERLGGMRQFVTPDDIVLIKPNIGWQRTPEQGANTHPAVVAELVRACRATGARRVVVTDCPVRKSRGAFERSGILEAAGNAGAEVIIPEDSRHYAVTLSPRLGIWDVLEPFVTATKIINVPVAKHHSLTGTTAGMKNWIGITNKLRIMFHNDLQRSIAELAALMLPTLTVIDASRVLMHNGPQGGSPDDVKPMHAIAAGVDPVALDAWACALMGTPPEEWPDYLQIAESMGLGTRDFRALQPVEISSG